MCCCLNLFVLLTRFVIVICSVVCRGYLEDGKKMGLLDWDY